jgi:hypothetical protein
MANQSQSETKIKKEGWNIRPFDSDLRIACQTQAIKEDMYDYAWVQKTLRDALGLPPETHVIDSAHESGKGEVRRGSQQVDTSRTAEAIRNKTRQKA